jgi:hypothetical protein
MGERDRLFRRGDGGSLDMGVILGNGNPEFKTPPADDEEVLLPKLELRLPPAVHGASSRPRTVNSLVKSNALVA